jgi:glucose/mannose-6-phosphate isomerase
MNKINKEILAQLDTNGMFQKIIEFPEQLRKGWEIGERTECHVNLAKIRHIVFTGMGGSAIAGDLVRSIHQESLTIPMIVNRDYQIPHFVNGETLFIASSYSGNTEETLSGYEEAIQREARIICITSGGRLEQIAQEKGHPLFRMVSGYPPRAALGFNLGLMLQIFHRLRIGKLSLQSVDQAASMLSGKDRIWSDIDHTDNEPLEVAGKLFRKLPLIYASVNHLEPVGCRWKTQINENSNSHAFFQPFPEMNHNEIVGWEVMDSTRDLLSDMIAVVLSDPEDHPRIVKRIEIFKTLIKADGHPVIGLIGEGDSFFQRMVYLIHFGDWVSYYLAILNQVNPTEILKIDAFKRHLSKNVTLKNTNSLI